MSSIFSEFCKFMQAVRPLLANSTTWGRYVPSNEQLWHWRTKCMTTDEVLEATDFMQYKAFDSLIAETLSVVDCVHSWLCEPYIGCWEVKLHHLVSLFTITWKLHNQLCCTKTSYESFLINGIRHEFEQVNRKCDSCVHAIVQKIEPFVLEAPLISVQNKLTSTLYFANHLVINEQQLIVHRPDKGTHQKPEEWLLSLNEYKVLWLRVRRF